MNDRSLRDIIVARNDSKNKDHHTSFCITVASEVMAIFCLSKNEEDFLNRVEDITVAYSLDNKLIFDKDLNCRNAIRFLIKDDLKPNLVQTKYRTPTFVHGGPFANIAHGTNFLIANDLTLKQADYVVTDDDFCSDLGMQKDLDVVSPLAELHPTIRALKLHVEMKFDELDKENIEAVKEGSKNLIKHLKNDRLYNISVIDSINKFKSDTTNEIKALESILKEEGFQYALNTSYVDGTKGGKDLAAIALDEIDMNNKIDFKPLVNKKMILEEKKFVIANKIYVAGKVEYSSRAKKELEEYSAKEYADYDVVISKIPTSLSYDPKLLNVPENFTLHIDSFRLFTGAKFIVPFTGEIFTMPGLPKVPAAKNMESTHK